jgi:ABC-2 type transport system ATP-binding protein
MSTTTIRSPELYDTDRASVVIALDDVHKRHGPTHALRGLSFSVPQGSICALLGPNGSGKTTTIKLLLGLCRPDTGSVRVFGLRADHESDSVEIRRRTAFVSETKELLPQLDVAGTIAMVRGFFPEWRHDLERKLLAQFALPATQKVSSLSKGMGAKLALLLACCRKTELLILDEPTDGLDPGSSEHVLETLVGMVAETGLTVLMSSHQLHEVERMADTAVFMREGRCVLQDDLDTLRHAVRRIDLRWSADTTHTVDELRAHFGVTVRVLRGATSAGRMSLLLHGDTHYAGQRLLALGAADVHERPVDLRELFLSVTGELG